MGLSHGFRFVGQRFLRFFTNLRQDLLPIEEREPDRVVVALAEDCAGFIDETEQKEVWHLIHHGEQEIAFEGLMISLMRADALPKDFDLAIWRRVATEYKTVEHATLDEHVWPKFEAWSSNKVSSGVAESV